MDKALVFGTKDCRFESCQGHFSAGGCFIAEGCQLAEFWVPAQARTFAKLKTGRVPEEHTLNFLFLIEKTELVFCSLRGSIS